MFFNTQLYGLFMKRMLIRSFFLLFLTTAIPLTTQSLEIKRAILVKSTCDVWFLIVKVIEDPTTMSMSYHIYQLQEDSGQFWGTHLEQLDTVKFTEERHGVKTTSFEAFSTIPTEFIFIRMVAPTECNFIDGFN